LHPILHTSIAWWKDSD